VAGNQDNAAYRILWVDDDYELTTDLAEYLGGEGFSIECAVNLADAARLLAIARYDLVIVDLVLPDGSGLSLIRDTPPVHAGEFVVLTGQGSVKTAIEALRHQVFDYLMKPVELGELRNVLTRARNARGDSHREPRATSVATPAARTAAQPNAATLLVGRSPAMQRAQALVTRAAAGEITVLIQGESGTGKEVAAQALHRLSRRADGPFVALNCAAVSPALIASELFGHEKGSFTGAHRAHKGIFERAEGGTLFLDEVTEMPLDLQANLLRVLETGTVIRVGGDEDIPVNVRVVAATNRDPLTYVEQGRFRLDLYYRLQVFPVVLPPLRERGDDVLDLARHFLLQFGGQSRSLSPATEAVLLRQEWPGNVRELRNVIERACLVGAETIEPDHLMLLDAPGQPVGSASESSIGVAEIRVDLGSTRLRDAEQEMILKTLAVCGGNKTRAAASLGISVKTLYNKLKRFDLLETERARS
jgi:DNA-binding NtrC family response regulator